MQDRSAYRLRGDIDGESRSFALAEGEQVLGSSRSADLPIGVPGVSRRHAVIEVAGERVSVRDAGSRNGSFVAGRRLGERATELTPGASLRLGPVSLVLEKGDAEDGRLGLELDLPSLSRTREGRETVALAGEQGFSRQVLDGVVSIVELMTLPRAELQAAIERVRGLFGARGVALVERPSATSKGVVLAACGETRRWSALVDEITSGDPAEGEMETGGGETGEGELGEGETPGELTWARQRSDGSLFALAVDAPAEPAPGALLDALLRILLRLRTSPAASMDTGGEAGVRAQVEASGEAGPADLVMPPGIVAGRSPAMKEFYQQMAAVAGTELPVLILGETGVGKEHLARALHLSSRRSEQAFVAVNCAAIPAEQLEAEMFGIGRGVATGVDARPGSFRRADGGTLLLDEVGELPLPLQAKLLRALQDGQVHPVGLAPSSVDVRIVAATNADLDARVEAGRFRADLYYRLAGCELRVPPLRQRREDLASLMAHFLQQASLESAKRIRGLSVKALRLLCDYAWPGNVRELEHEMRRLALRSLPHQAIDSTLLGERIRSGPKVDEARLRDLDAGSMDLDRRLDALHESLIRQALDAAAGNQTRAASKLGISRSGLIKRMKRLGIDAGAYVDR